MNYKYMDEMIFIGGDLNGYIGSRRIFYEVFSDKYGIENRMY